MPAAHARNASRWPCGALSRRGPAFTLLELVMVVVVVGTIGAIAVPRMVSASENAKAASLEASRVVFQKALDLYVEEHAGLNANQEPDGSAGNDASAFAKRMTNATDASGRIDPQGLYGPYLRAIPVNTFAATQGVRLTGGASPRDYAWYFDSATNTIVPDQVRVVVGSVRVGPGRSGTTEPATPEGTQLPIETGMAN